MKLLSFMILVIIIPWSNCKHGLVQEILPWDETTVDVTPSIRSLQASNNALAVNYIDDFDSVVKQTRGYMQKVSGFFKAPESGEYKFYSSCSGPCQIFIGQNEKATPKRIITQKEESLHNEFTRYPDQVSHTIYLEKDKQYFIEGIEKQHGGLGHLSVGVVLPSDKKIFPLSKSYLKTDTNGDLKRKGEILRNNGKELTKQRDKMFTKLREINDYIKKLTDAVKRNPITEEKKGKMKASQKIEENNDGVQLKDKTEGGGEEGQEIKTLSKNDNAKDRGIKNGQDNINIKLDKDDKETIEGRKTEEMKGRNNNSRLETKENKEKGNDLGQDYKAKDIMDINPKTNDEGNIQRYNKEGKRKEEEKYSNEMKDNDPEKMKNSNEIIKTKNSSAENKNIEESKEENKIQRNSKEKDNDAPELTAEKENIITPKVLNDLHGGKQNLAIANSIEPNVLVEHNYIKVSRSHGHTDSMQSTSTYSVNPDVNDDIGDDDEVIQLTNYAKEEISKHGQLSEKALKNLIKVIKRKLIEDGFIKKKNASKSSDMTNQNEYARKVTGNMTMNEKGNKNNYNKDGLDEKTKKDEGKILLYDKVVSNLMDAIKESTQTNNIKGENADEGSEGGIERTKTAMMNGENEQRKRMLSSLYLLSSEIEKFKNVLKGVQNKENREELGETVAASLKDANTQGNGVIPKVEETRFDSDVKKDETKTKETKTVNDKKEEKLKQQNDEENENKDINLYSRIKNLVNEKGEMFIFDDKRKGNGRQSSNEGKMKADISSSKIERVDGDKENKVESNAYVTNGNRFKDITPKLNLDEQEGESTKRKENKMTIKQALNKPMLVEGYTKLIAGIGDESKNNKETENDAKDSKLENTQRGATELNAVNASKRNTYTDALTETVEQYLPGVTLPILLGEQIIKGQNTKRNYQKTATKRTIRGSKINSKFLPFNQKNVLATRSVVGSKKTRILKHIPERKKKIIKKRLKHHRQ